VGYASATEGTGEFVVLHRRAMQKIVDEQRELVDRLALAEAELELIREERDDLLRRAEAAKAIWREVKPHRPMAEGP
jgi:hypothetical protein